MNDNLYLMVRFGELNTKGKNKKDFILLLAKNIKNSLKDYQYLEYDVLYDHIYIKLNGHNYEEILDTLKDISGIKKISLVYKCEKNLDEINDICLQLIDQTKDKTFKLNCKRADKSFPLHSDEIIRKIATNILKTYHLKVDVHHPDKNIFIEVRNEACYVFEKTFEGAGGYPLGSGGKALLMLSGGIDSPVAMYLMMKRGIKIDCIHFASPPYTQVGVIYKLYDLLHVLNKYQDKINLIIVPFTKIQDAIYNFCPESYAITIMRRMMYRISEQISKQRKCLAIVNGESIGQVASQTLVSMQTINEVINTLVIRPLAVFDKTDIISIAQKIKTYDISIRPFEDCCTIFTPKSPKTAPKSEDVSYYESKFDWKSLIDDAIKNIEVKLITNKDDDLI